MAKLYGITCFVLVLVACGPKTRKDFHTTQDFHEVRADDLLKRGEGAVSHAEPKSKAIALTFHDLDRDPGEIAGFIRISRSPDQDSFTHYALYWGLSDMEKYSEKPFVTLNKEDEELQHRIEVNTSIPEGVTHILVFTVNQSTEMSGGISTPIFDSGSPSGGLLSASFADSDSDAGKIGGDLLITPMKNSEASVPFFSAYWGRDMFTRSVSEKIARIPNLGNNNTLSIPNGTRVPEDSFYILIYSEDEQGRGNLTFALPIGDMGLPEEGAISLSFSDRDPRGGYLGGVVDITRAGDESNITKYRIYWGENATFKLSPNPLGEIPKTGKNISWSFPPDYQRPPGATHLLVRTANTGGEMLTGISATITDEGVPESRSTYIRFTDTDLKADSLKGTLSLGRAEDETDITHYNLYWGSGDRRGNLITSLEKSLNTLSLGLDSLRPQGATHFHVYTANQNGEMTEGMSTLIYDKGLPENKAGAVTYQDTNSVADLLGGLVMISRALGEEDVTHYNLYWGRSATEKHSPTPLVSFEKKRELIYIIPQDLALPPDATHFIVHTANRDGEMLSGSAHLIDDYGLPENIARDFTFTDTNLLSGTLQGTISITPAEDVGDHTHYKIYWANSSGQKLFPESPVARVTKESPSFTLSTPTVIPATASRFLIVSENGDGEMVTGFSKEFTDQIVPLKDAVSVSMSNLSDSHLNIRGNITISVNAADEANGFIEHYRVYLSNNATTRPVDATHFARVAANGSALTVPVSTALDLNGMTHVVIISENKGIEKANGVGVLVAKAAKPQFSPDPSVTYTSAQSVSLSTETPGATIHYTTDGSTPDTDSPVYSGPFNLSATTIVRAFTRKSGVLLDSGISVATYTINIP